MGIFLAYDSQPGSCLLHNNFRCLLNYFTDSSRPAVLLPVEVVKRCQFRSSYVK